MVCIDCGAPATIQFVDVNGCPIGTLCGPCDEGYQKMREAIFAMFEKYAVTGNK